MPITLYQTDDVTELNGVDITNENAGADSDTITFHAKNDDLTGHENLLILQRTASALTPNVRVASGVPPQDQMWGRIRIVGYDNTADPTWSVANTDWEALGAYSTGPLVPTIPAGCVVHYEYLSHPPGDADPIQWIRSLVPLYNAYSMPAPPALTKVARGILTGFGDYARGGIISGCEVTATGTPDDQVHSAAGTYLYKGIVYTKIATDHTLNQTALSGSLTAGQSYWAALTLNDAGVTVTKGARSTTPVKPTLPAGEVFLRYVRVDYQGGGTSIIDSADLDGTTLYDRYLPADGGGLNLNVHPGFALGGGTYRFSSSIQVVPLTDNDTNYVWQLASGSHAATLTPDPPETTALPIATVVTVSGAIDTITDTRIYANTTGIRGDSTALAISVDGAAVGSRPEVNFVTGTNVTLTVTDNPGDDRVDVQIDATGGGGGTGKYNPDVAPASIFFSEEFTGGTFTETWRWANQGSATDTVQLDTALLYAPTTGSGTSAYRTRWMTSPGSADWVATTKVYPRYDASVNQGGMLVLVTGTEGTPTLLVRFMVYNGAGVYKMHWGSITDYAESGITTWTDATITAVGTSFFAPIYLQLHYDTSSKQLSAWYSWDGMTFTQFGSTQTLSADPPSIGRFLSSSSATVDAWLRFFFFRVRTDATGLADPFPTSDP